MSDDPTDELVVDGNAVAGALHIAFGEEVTNNEAECASCGAVARVGALTAYTRAPGVVLRCPSCSGIMVRLVETPHGMRTDVRARRLPSPR